MFLSLQILVVLAFIDYIIYICYIKNYNIIINNDIYKYRIILRMIIWFLILTLKNTNYICISLISMILYIIEKIYFRNIYNNINYIVADTILSIIYINIIIIIAQLT